jgi:hypothetical protein
MAKWGSIVLVFMKKKKAEEVEEKTEGHGKYRPDNLFLLLTYYLLLTTGVPKTSCLSVP